MTRRRQALGCLGTLVLVALGIFALLFAVVRYFDRELAARWEPELQARADIATRVLEPYLADQRTLSQHPFFADMARERDASPYLNRILAWDGDDPRIETWNQAVGQLPTHLPPDLVEKLAVDWKADVWRHTHKVDYASLDFSWMEFLHEFDHWDPWKGEPLSLLELDPLLGPVPDHTQLKWWATLRMMWGMHHGELELAARDVRQLARLEASTGEILGTYFAANMLLIEREAFQAAQARNVPTGDWRPWFSDEDHERYVRVAKMADSFGALRVSAGVRERAWASTAPIGRCAAVSEAMTRVRIARSFLGDLDPTTWPDVDAYADPSCGSLQSQLETRDTLAVDALVASHNLVWHRRISRPCRRTKGPICAPVRSILTRYLAFVFGPGFATEDNWTRHGGVLP